jgi:metallo-beta-lactamase family protein
MAVDATAIYARYPELHGHTAAELASERASLSGRNVHLVRSVEQSKRINDVDGPALILSSSGMLTGGRVLHHLARLLPDPRHLIALVGYQAAGTRGRALQEGAPTLRIHARDVPVRAQCVDLGHLSGHADRNELQTWLQSARRPPRIVFATHGEPEAAAALAAAVRARGWDGRAAELGQRVEL